MKAACEVCGKVRALHDYTPNQMVTKKWCAACIKAEQDRRSTAARGKAGRKPRSPSQLEDQIWKCYLNSPDAKILELWLTTEGYTGTRGEMLKRHLLAIIKAARQS
jgi:hypothetical protein